MNISSVIEKSSILFETKAIQKEDALKMMIDCLSEHNRITSKKGFLDAVKQREQECCTYIGYDIAIPHAKSKYVMESSIVFLRIDHPIIYGENDEKVKCLFMLAIPENGSDTHLRLLSRIATKLMDNKFRDAITEAKDKDEVYQIIKDIENINN